MKENSWKTKKCEKNFKNIIRKFLEEPKQILNDLPLLIMAQANIRCFCVENKICIFRFPARRG